jgi:lipopolysaccharide/colanic/teichoic acid biosynthesis glycosyltransferase
VPRPLDFLIALAALVVSAPLLLAAAVAIKLDSRGPVFYRQTRIGRFGAPFDIWKLRTMTVGAEHQGAGLYIEPGDSRITRVGALLRRFSLDELPNLFNVLAGEMAVVGPRPTVEVQVRRYTPHQRRRLDVKPGITGWAQVNGRTSISWPERIELDVDYVDRRSFALDVRILLRTVKMLASGEGLYSSELEQGWGGED